MDSMLLVGALFAAVALVALVFAGRRHRRGGNDGDAGSWTGGSADGGHCDAGSDGGGCDGGGGGD